MARPPVSATLAVIASVIMRLSRLACCRLPGLRLLSRGLLLSCGLRCLGLGLGLKTLLLALLRFTYLCQQLPGKGIQLRREADTRLEFGDLLLRCIDNQTLDVQIFLQLIYLLLHIGNFFHHLAVVVCDVDKFAFGPLGLDEIVGHVQGRTAGFNRLLARQSALERIFGAIDNFFFVLLASLPDCVDTCI